MESRVGGRARVRLLFRLCMRVGMEHIGLRPERLEREVPVATRGRLRHVDGCDAFVITKMSY